MPELNLSELLLNLVYSAADEGIEMLRQAALVPFALVMRKEGVALQRFPAEDTEGSLAKAESILRAADSEVLAYTLVYDALIEIDGKDKDALVLEAGEIDSETAYRFAQRYQTASPTRPPYPIGELAYLGTAENYLKTLS